MNIYLGGLLGVLPGLVCWAVLLNAVKQPITDVPKQRTIPGNILLPIPEKTQLPSYASLKDWSTGPGELLRHLSYMLLSTEHRL